MWLSRFLNASGLTNNSDQHGYSVFAHLISCIWLGLPPAIFLADSNNYSQTNRRTGFVKHFHQETTTIG